MRRRAATVLLVVAVAVTVWAITTTNRPDTPAAEPRPGQPDPLPVAAETVSPEVDDPSVLVISVDGLNPDAIDELGDRVPTFQQLIASGATTLNARTDHDITVTLPNHTGMVT